MKLKENEKNSISANLGGEFETNEFRVEASAKMFGMISSNIYSNPAEAVIRELACNSYDSHKEAGNEDEPFDIRIPSRYDDEFYIRDYGTGLSAEEINEIYTVVFKSDKTDTNDLTGCFGVGSKSPFAITNDFTVESFQDGKKMLYSVFMDNGIPKITSLGTTPTTERNGFKVSFKCPQEHIYDMRDAAAEVLSLFDPTPNVFNYNKSLNVREDYIQAQGDDWVYYKNPGRYSENRYTSRIIMGNVAYQIDKSEVKNYIPSLDIHLELGAVNPAVSREYIQYDQDTRELLNEKFKEISQEIVQSVQDEIDEQSNIWDAKVIYFNAKHKSAYADAGLMDHVTLTYNGEEFDKSMSCKIDDMVDDLSKYEYDTGDIEIYYYDASKAKKRRYLFKSNKGYEIEDLGNKTISMIRGSKYANSEYQRNKVEFVYIDKDYGKYSKGKYYINHSGEMPSGVQTVYFFSGPLKLYYEIVDFLEQKPKNITDLPDKPKRTRGTTGKGKAKVLVFDKEKYSSKNRNYWRVWDDDKDDDVSMWYCVEVNRYKWRHKENQSLKDPSRLYNKLRNLRKKYGAHINVLGVKTANLDHIEKEPNWKMLDEELEKFMDYVLQGFPSEEFIQGCALNNIGSYYNYDMEEASNLLSYLSKALFDNYYGSSQKDKYESFAEKLDDKRFDILPDVKADFIRNNEALMGKEYKEGVSYRQAIQERAEAMIQEVDDLLNEYPMFKKNISGRTRYNFFDSLDDDVIEYINMINACDGWT